MNEKMHRVLGRPDGQNSVPAAGTRRSLGAPASAQATLLEGETVSFTYFFPDLGTVYLSPADGNYLVGPGVEIPNGFCCVVEGTLDISDTNLLADFGAPSAFYAPAAFNGFRISDVFGTIDSFASVLSTLPRIWSASMRRESPSMPTISG